MILTPANYNAPPPTSKMAASLALVVQGFGDLEDTATERLEQNIRSCGAVGRSVRAGLRIIGIHVT